jgi:hypothetical protein
VASAIPSADDKSAKAKATKIKRFMKEFVLSPSAAQLNSLTAGGSGGGGGNTLALTSCSQVLHHRAARNHLLLVYPRDQISQNTAHSSRQLSLDQLWYSQNSFICDWTFQQCSFLVNLASEIS